MTSWEHLRQVLRKEGLLKTSRRMEQWAAVAFSILILLVLAYIFGRTHQVDKDSARISALNAQLDTLSKNIAALDDSAKILAVQRDSARTASAKTLPAVVKGREEVKVVSPGVLQVRTPSDSTPREVETDTAVTSALTAERNRVDSLEKEVAIADSQALLDSARIAERDQKIEALEEKVEVLEKKASCKILWLVSCPSRKQAAVIGGVAVAVGVVAVKVVVNSVKHNATSSRRTGG